LPGHTEPTDKQRAIALDFAANIAAGLRILQQKWNATRAANMIVNDGDPANIENWFFAIWAYNTGFYPESMASANHGAWGVGWANNPINPKYDQSRPPFLAYSYNDAREPQRWPYQEKVIGFAAYPPDLPDGENSLVPAYRPAWWGGSDPEWNRLKVKPPATLFCDASNDCDPGGSWTPNASEPPPSEHDVTGEPDGPCYHKNSYGDYDLRCWYHESVSWKTCIDDCGYELLRFDPGWPYQEDQISFPPVCDRRGLPSNAIVVDDIPNGVPSIRPGCTRPVSQGTFELTFGSDAKGLYPSKVDFHQLGAGFGAHFWFSHTRPASDTRMHITGRWTPATKLNGWVRVMVHLPDHGAWTQQAKYVISTGSGSPRVRYLSTQRRANTWISLGVYPFDSAGEQWVELSNVTHDGTGYDDIAWDAVAFAPLPDKPTIVVAMGDSYTSGEGAEDYYRETDRGYGTQTWNACRRSVNSWPRKTWLPGMGKKIGEIVDLDPSVPANVGPWQEVEFTSVACSGAEINDVTGIPNSQGQFTAPYYWTNNLPLPSLDRAAEGQFHEVPQLHSGVLNEYTDLVVLTIGGNDAGFPDVVRDCALSDCTGNEADYQADIAATQDDVKNLLQQIRSAAPNARVILLGYPRLFAVPTKTSCGPLGIYSYSEMTMINRLAGYFDQSQAAAVAAVNDPNVEYLSVLGNFLSGACPSALGMPETINAVVVAEAGGGDFHMVSG